MGINEALNAGVSRFWTRRNGFLLAGGCLAVAAAFIWSLATGVAPISFADIYGALFHYNPDSNAEKIFMESRLPNTLHAMLYGAAVAAAGVLLQRAARITAACPTTLGLMPASLASMILAGYFNEELDGRTYMLICIFGAGAGLLLAYLLSLAVPMKPAGMRLLVGGLTAAGIAGLTLYLTLMASHQDIVLAGMRFGLWFAPLTLFQVILPCLVLCLVLSAWMNGRHNPAWLIAACLVLAVVLTGTAVATMGSWAMTGLIATALARLLAGNDYRMAMPLAVMIGAIVISLLETASGLIFPPLEIRLDDVTEWIGLPVLVVLVWREAVRFAREEQRPAEQGGASG